MPDKTHHSLKDDLVDKIPTLEPKNTVEFVSVCVLACWVFYLFYRYMEKKPPKKSSQGSDSGLYISSDRKLTTVIECLDSLKREIADLKHENRMKSDSLEILIKRVESVYHAIFDGLEGSEVIFKTTKENNELIIALSDKFDKIKMALIGTT